jgi:hypothetical protein
MSASGFASFLMRKQAAVFGAAVLGGAGITFATGRPAHELLTHGACSQGVPGARRGPRGALAAPKRRGAANTGWGKSSQRFHSRASRRASLAPTGATSASSDGMAYSFRLHGSGPPMSQ